MRRRRRNIKSKSTYFKKILEQIKERLIITISIALISWITGVLTNNRYTSGVIKELKQENADLDWAVDYFRQ